MIYIYEDELYKNFLPLVYLRPVFALYCGHLSLYEKIKQLYPAENFELLVRPLLASFIKETYPNIAVNDIIKNDTISLFLSARTILREPIEITGEEEIFVTENNDLVGLRTQNSRIKQIPINTKAILNWRLPKKQVKTISIKYLWELIELNHQELINDFSKPAIHGKFSPHAFIIGDISNLYLGVDAEIEAGAIIDLRSGPIYIDANAKILALSKISGPAYIGKNTILDQAKISGGTTIGENCRVSGEIESSIFHGFVNKHHNGFIGHSYIGEWVNLGAGTTNSDLKNNYSTVKVKLGNKEIDTKQMKVGCFIGDHAKIAIGTMIPTGAVIGIFANVFEPRANLKSISNFYWTKGTRWLIEKAITTARVVMSRRNVALTKTQEALISKIYKTK